MGWESGGAGVGEGRRMGGVEIWREKGCGAGGGRGKDFLNLLRR